MQEQIRELYNKIKLVLDTELPKYTEYIKYGYDIAPKKSEIGFGELLPWCKGIYTLEEIKHIINKAEQEASKYHRSNVLVQRDSRIYIEYYETEQEVYDRLCKRYEHIVNYITGKKEEDHKRYLELKAQFESL